MERQLWVPWKEGERSGRLGSSAAASVGDGELASKVTGAGVSPRPMDLQRLLHPVQEEGCLLQLFSKPDGDGAPVDMR